VKDSRSPMEKLIIEIDEVAPMLNGSGGLKNMHFQVYRKLRDRWVWLIASKTRQKIKGKVTIAYTRSSVVAPDWDNISASFKPIGDALVTNGVIEDDNPKVVLEFIPKWRKAKNNKDLKTIIEITPI
jgi:Holliday junction resolvase RusA-like endonuclease